MTLHVTANADIDAACTDANLFRIQTVRAIKTMIHNVIITFLG